MQSRLRMFDRTIKACNPHKEFWDYLEWLARRRHYPEPMYVWNNTFGPGYLFPDNNKFRSNKKMETYHFPAAHEDDEILICRMR